MSVPSDLLDEVSRHCDLRDRLPLVPATARVRGVYFRNIEHVLEGAGKVAEYRRVLPERYSAMRWYPATELLLHLAVGGAILISPERVHEGMFEIGRRNAAGLSESLLGRTLLWLLSNDPVKLLHQGAAARRQTTAYGEWEVSFPAPRTAVMQMRHEYLYIESYCRGAAQGTFEAVALPSHTEVVLEDRFNGKHIITW